ncbi:hypothetical protein [Streptomyces sp. IBSBF 2435]|uniref:hypothetical protein n=1 Tax=Streptomyces sp. IBSBF 2435 TaxID=2903531 RepID=UPI002FDC4848
MPNAGDTTSAERLERLREVLTGSGARPPGGGRGLSGCRYGNVLIGAALHGADRLRAGEAPTELEGLLLAVLRAAVPEAELPDWGRVYRETVTARGRLDLVPEVLTGRPVSLGYGMADLRSDVRAVAEEALGCRNVALLSAESLAEGGPLHSAEFAAGVRESGFGVVGVAGAARRAAGGVPEPAAAPFRAAWEVAAGRGAGVFWTGDLASAAGPADASAPAVVLGGEGADRISFGIHGGRGGGERYREVMRRLGVLTDSCTRAMGQDDGGLPVPGMEFTGLVWEVLKLFAFVREQVGDHDEESYVLGLTFGRGDVAVLFHRREVELDLDTGGRAPVRLAYRGERPAFPAGDLEYATCRADGPPGAQPRSWSAPVPLGWQSVTAPSLVSYRDALHAVFARPGDHALMWSRLDGGVWRAPARVGGSDSLQRAALTVHGGLLYCFHTTPGGDVLWNRFDGSVWTPEVRVDGWDSPVSPAVASHDGSLWVSHRDHGRRIHVDRFTADHRPAFGYRFDSSISDSAPALVSTGATLWVAHRGLDDKVRVRYSDKALSAADWQDHEPAHDLLTQRSPTLAGRPGTGLHLLARGADGRLHLGVRTDGGGWAGIAAPARDGAFPALDAGGAAFHHGKLYAMYRR